MSSCIVSMLVKYTSALRGRKEPNFCADSRALGCVRILDLTVTLRINMKIALIKWLVMGA